MASVLLATLLLAFFPLASTAAAQIPTRRAFTQDGLPATPQTLASLDSQEANTLFAQGMAWLHAGDNFEAERSFRQVAALQPSAAMAYWAVALANESRPARARQFMAMALAHRDRATQRHRGYLDALARFYEVDAALAERLRVDWQRRKRGDPLEVYRHPHDKLQRSAKQRSLRLLTDWQNLSQTDSEDLDARALVVRRVCLLTRDRHLVGAASPWLERTRQHLRRIFAKAPRHPARLYPLRFRFLAKPHAALGSLRVASLHAAGLHRTWSAAGTLLSSLHRHADAILYQESALRLAHAHLHRQQAMPFTLSTYAADAAAYARSLARLGRVREALSWLDYLYKLPKHPQHNSLKKPTSIVRQAIQCLAELRAQYRLDAKVVPWAHLATPPRSVVATRSDALLAQSKRLQALRMLTVEVRQRPNRLPTMLRWLELHNAKLPVTQQQSLRRLAGHADLEQPLLAKLRQRSSLSHWPDDWRLPRDLLVDWPRDLGALPQPKKLGPARWLPRVPRQWTLRDAQNKKVALSDYRGKPVLVVLYLGFG